MRNLKVIGRYKPLRQYWVDLEVSFYVLTFALNLIFYNMAHIIRELSKLCMFAIAWGIPVLLSRWNENNMFLWMFMVSFLVTVAVLNHYEELERVDDFKSDCDEHE